MSLLGLGAKMLLKLGKPWLYRLAVTAAHRATVAVAGSVQRNRLAKRMADARPEELVDIVQPFLEANGFATARIAPDTDGVLILGTVPDGEKGGRQLLVVRVQARDAACDEKLIGALENAAGEGGNALLIAAGDLSVDVRTAALSCTASIGVLDASEYAAAAAETGWLK